jgi:hypothetical protein
MTSGHTIESFTFEHANAIQRAPDVCECPRELRANPEGSVTVGGQSRRFRAVEAEGDRRRGIWDQALRVYPGWSQYEGRATNRRIAVFVLEPV